MADLARQLAMPLSLDEVLTRATATVLESIPSATHAGFLLFTKSGKFETKAPSSELIYELDRLQIEHGEGPCIEAAVDELIVRTDDFQRDQRWPHLSRAAQARDPQRIVVRCTSQRNAGALNVFATEPGRSGPEDEGIGQVLAQHAAAAILASRLGVRTAMALERSRPDGQAKASLWSATTSTPSGRSNCYKASQTEERQAGRDRPQAIDTRDQRRPVPRTFRDLPSAHRAKVRVRVAQGAEQIRRAHNASEFVQDLVLERLGLGAEHRLHAVADVRDSRGAERFEPGVVDLALVGDLHAQPVMQASTFTRLARPPNAAISCSARVSGTTAVRAPVPVVIAVADPAPRPGLACCSASDSAAGSRPGVRRFHRVIANRKHYVVQRRTRHPSR